MNRERSETNTVAPLGEHVCLTKELTLGFGRNAKDNRPHSRTLTFAELIQELGKPDVARGALTSAEYHVLDKADPIQKSRRNQEKDGPYFVACHLGGDGRRCNENADRLCGIALDFDSGKTTKYDIQRLLTGYAFVAYTSYSHRAEHEKWRVFVPYKESVNKELHAEAFEWFQALFLEDIDPHCATPAQFWYTPACPNDAVHSFQCFFGVGELFVPMAIQSSPKSAETVTLITEVGNCAGPALSRLTSALRSISSDERKTWIDFGIAIKHDLGDAGLAAWLTWSRTSAKFDLDDALRTWESFKSMSTGPKITLGTIFYMARERGWVDQVKADEVPEHIAQINQCYFLAPQGGKTEVFKEGVDPFDGHHTLQAMGLSDFKALFSNAFVESPDARGQRKPIPLGVAWLKDPNRRQFEGVILAPNGDVPGYYNRWRGYTVEPRAGSWKLMREHIRTILCNADAQVFEYLLGWLAFCVQRPGERAEVAIVMQGGRGTGKGVFARAIGSLFGQHFSHISQARHLTGNFNAHLEDCLLLFVDEAFWAGDKQGEAVLKQLITEPTMTIERKGQDSEKCPNRLHILMASNSDWVVPAGVDERRFLVLVVADAKRQDAAYFAALSNELESGGLEAMLYDLLQRDIRDFNHRRAPVTTGLTDQKLLSLEPHQQWFFERLHVGSLTECKDEWECVPTARVHDNYIESVKKTGQSHRAGQTALGMRLRRMLPKGFPRRVKREEGVHGLSGPCPHYVFPPLDVCRKYFEVLVGLDGYEWESDGGAD